MRIHSIKEFGGCGEEWILLSGGSSVCVWLVCLCILRKKNRFECRDVAQHG